MAKANVNVTIRLDEDVKQEFENFCDAVGLNMTVAINMFIKATLRIRALPFVVTDRNTYPAMHVEDLLNRHA
ncbi:MAG: type II toxin-antitoxin system RelB/DinJ family antitoxin [Defluviitaleaceae bacterium]|nr:type II toxin-antitoxin system RelB/DinJ family antitoxin [Defluviitaleaceae bacterium]